MKGALSMFCIPCKYNKKSNHIIGLVKQIRTFHQSEKIIVVDSGSDDKSYFKELEAYNTIILDVNNTNWMIGAYWTGFFAYPNEDHYFFIHDSTKIKASLEHLKINDLTLLATFDKSAGNFNGLNEEIRQKTNYKNIKDSGYGCYGPMFFCKGGLMHNLYNNNVHLVLPNTKQETGWLEGGYGAIFEEEGFDLMKCSLYGNILTHESPGGKSYPYPFNTSWQFPIEKFYASHMDNTRL